MQAKQVNIFKDKVYWIIGASCGIGEALAKSLASKGAKIAITARDQQNLERVKSLLEGQGHLVFQSDVTDYEKLSKTAKAISASMGKIDSMIFMAASYKNPDSIATANIEVVKKIIDINFMGAVNSVHSILPIFNDQKHGQIVLCASVDGFRGLPNGQPYCATKAAIINYAESLKIELENIDVKIICPGFVKTRLTDKNNFKMPFIISSEKAAEYIIKDINSKKFEIHFPKRFTYFVKLLRVIPNWLFFSISKHLK
jgi:short-subunit dehydrogenase